MELNADDPDTNYNFGMVLVGLGESEAALPVFLNAVELKEDYADAYYQIGTIYIGQNNQADTVTSLEKFLELAPDHPQAAIAKQLLDYLKKIPYSQTFSIFLVLWRCNHVQIKEDIDICC